MIHWGILLWMWSLGAITGALIRHWVYLGRARTIRNKIKRKSIYKRQ